MQAVPPPLERHQSRRALAVSSGPMSQRRSRGGADSDSRVNSSTTWSSLSGIGGDVELLVRGPDVVEVGGCHAIPPAWSRWRVASACHDVEAPVGLLPPQALDLLAIDRLALSKKHGVGSAIAPARMAFGEAARAGFETRHRDRLRGLVALGGAVLADDRARPPLRQTRVAPGASPRLGVSATGSPVSPHQFPRLISRRASTSSVNGARILTAFRQVRFPPPARVDAHAASSVGTFP